MPIGIEPRPWRQCSFADWMKRCKAVDEWKKSLQSMNSREFAIHRKLGEAAGFAHRYVIPARGSGKSMFYWDYSDEELYEAEEKTDEFQYTTTMIDQDILGWDDPARRERAEEIVNELRKQYSLKDRREMCRTFISSFNPYLQPEGYWYDPSWEIRDDGSLRLREVSIMPGYLLDKEDL